MHILLRLCVPLLLVVFFAVLPGCLKYTQTVTLMPDGSGKIDITMQMSPRMMAELPHPQQPFLWFKPERVKKYAKGIAAFTEPTFGGEDGYQTMAYTVYFEDINKVFLPMNDETEDGGRTAGLAYTRVPDFKFVREGDTATLTCREGVFLSLAADYDKPEGKEVGSMRKEFKGVDITERYILPGTFADQKGVLGVDNTATLRITLEDIINDTGSLNAFKGKDAVIFEIGDITVTDDAVRAFRKEIAAAVKAAEEKAEQAGPKPE